MYFSDAISVLVRRWLVLLVGLFLLGGIAGLVVKNVPTQYQASGQLLLVLPAQASGALTPTNPYLNLQTGLTTTASIISSTVMTKDTEREMAKDGFQADYSASILPGAGPIITVSAKSPSQTNVLKTRDEVVSRLVDQLTSLQTQVEVPQTQVIKALPFNVDKQAEVLPGNKIRALIAASVAIMVATLVSAFLIDGWRRRRSPGPKGQEPNDEAILERAGNLEEQAARGSASTTPDLSRAPLQISARSRRALGHAAVKSDPAPSPSSGRSGRTKPLKRSARRSANRGSQTTSSGRSVSGKRRGGSTADD